MNDIKILGLYIGEPKKLANSKLLSSISSRTGPQSEITVDIDKIMGDRVQNLKYHGGDDRVIHIYPSEHYSYWKEAYPEKKDFFYPASIGENISSIGLIEKDVYIGDIYRIGEVVLQVTEPRTPCGSIDLKYGIKLMHKEVAQFARCGWMCRVITPGKINKNSFIELLEKGDPRFSIHEVMMKSKVKKDFNFMGELLEYECLSHRYRENLKRKIEQKKAPRYDLYPKNRTDQ
jgi:MOSC domain-containing protein YiiM